MLNSLEPDRLYHSAELTVFVFLALQTMQQQEAVSSTLLMLGKQVLIFCKESRQSANSCCWKL